MKRMKRMKRMNGATCAALAAAIALTWGAARGQSESEQKVAVADQASGKQSEIAQDQQKLEDMAKSTLARLRTTQPASAKLLDEAYGYAVFDATKGGLIVTGVGGTGVAMKTKGNPDPIFMHIGGAGIGLGAGIENYKMVLLFEDQPIYDEFVSGKWDASASAQAAAARTGKATEATWNKGVAVYRMTDAGLIAQIDVSGLKFWPSDRLNGPEEKQEKKEEKQEAKEEKHEKD